MSLIWPKSGSSSQPAAFALVRNVMDIDPPGYASSGIAETNILPKPTTTSLEPSKDDMEKYAPLCSPFLGIELHGSLFKGQY